MKIYKVAVGTGNIQPTHDVNMDANKLQEAQRNNASIQQASVNQIQQIMEALAALEGPINVLNDLLPGALDFNKIQQTVTTEIQATADYANIQNINGGSNLQNFLNSTWLQGTRGTLNTAINTPIAAAPAGTAGA
jgi:hypothetical protein